jgi:hypothetical protein
MPRTNGRLRAALTRLAVLAAGLCAALPVAQAHADTKRTSFVILRNGTQIGTNTIDVECTPSQTTVATVTHIEVTLAFVTLYRFEQTETEQWSGRQLLSLRARTDDNGRIHQTIARRTGDVLAVERDDQEKNAPATVMPLDVWNPAVLTQTTVLDPQGGSVVPFRAIDRGEEDFVSGGHPTRAHRYTITAGFSQDVWYDTQGELVGLQLTGSDGSIIRYQRA